MIAKSVALAVFFLSIFTACAQNMPVSATTSGAADSANAAGSAAAPHFSETFAMT